MRGPVPFTLVSGFLGSGKTSLINALLAHAGFSNTGIIVNEIGETGIDHLLLETGPEAVALLANGCLCCALRSDLPDALERLERRRAAAGLDALDRVILETSGLAEPGPVLMSLLSEPRVASGYRLESIVVTADAVHLPAQLERFRETARQLALADRIVLTKTDRASAAEADLARAALRGVNPGATLMLREDAIRNPSRLFGAALYDRARGRFRVAAWLREERPAAESIAHSSGVQCFVVRFAKRPRWSALDDFLRTLLALEGARVLRLKGVVRTLDHPAALAVHAVHHQLHVPVELPETAALPEDSVLVFVTQDLARVDVLDAMRRWGLADTDDGSASGDCKAKT